MKSSRRLVERARRYAVNENYVLRVTLKHYDDNDVPRITHARLVDLSPGGAKLVLATPLAFHDDLIVTLENEELELSLSLSARICWLRQQAGDSWVMGCSFDPQLPDEELKRLFSYGLLERRETPRQSVRGQVTIHWELRPEETPVGLLDLSEGGFSILSPMEPGIGTRLQLFLQGDDGQRVEHLSNVHWQMKVEGGWVIGCGFATATSFAALKSCFCPQDPPPRRSRKLLSVLSVATCATLLYWCWQYLARL